jgi:hypothetical protein
MLNWIFWQVPVDYVRRYLVTLWLVMFVIPPLLFGIQFTKMGFILNLLWYDLIFYGWYRVKQQIEGDEE